MNTKKRPVLVAKRYVRTHALTRASLARVMSEAELSGLVFQGERVTQEALVNASWLLLGALGPEWTAENLRPFLALMDDFPDESVGESHEEFVKALADMSERLSEVGRKVRASASTPRFLEGERTTIKTDGEPRKKRKGGRGPK